MSKRYSELTPEERREAGIAQDAGDGRTPEQTAARLNMATAEVRAVLAQQSAAWAAKRPARIQAQQIAWPKQAPPVCASCVSLWVGGVLRARKAQVHERRAVECCHLPGTAGELYEVAYLTASGQWLTVSEVRGDAINSLYAGLLLDDGREYLERGNATNKALSDVATRGVALARMRARAPIIAALAALAGFLPTEDTT